MEKILRQSVGIDCSKDKLDVSFGVLDDRFDTHIISTTTFENKQGGWKKMMTWVKRLKQSEMELAFVVEATGVYHEQLSVFLYEQGSSISVLLPNKVKNFAKTLSVKTVTDKICAQTIAQFGLEKKLDKWAPPQKIFNQLRQLTRERGQLNDKKTQVLCQLHAEESGAWINKQSVVRMKERIKLIKKQIAQIGGEIREVVKADRELTEKIKRICSIHGIGFLTAVTVLAETDGFNLIRNKKQLVSYAGLDVVEKTSGTSVKGKTRISGKGNKYLRKAMYMPALSAIGKDGKMKQLFVRLVSKHGIKMKAAVAVQRKLLELIYVLWKKNESFDPCFGKKKLEQLQEAALNEMA